MRNKTARFLALVLCLIFTAFSAVTCVSAADGAEITATAENGEEKSASVTLEVGETNENGIFDVTFAVANADFMGLQFEFSFDPQVVVAVDAQGNPTNDFAAFAQQHPVQVNGADFNISLLAPFVSNEEGYFRLAGYALILGEDRLVHLDEAGTVMFTLRFRQIAEGAYGFALKNDVLQGQIAVPDETVPFTLNIVYKNSALAENGSSQVFTEEDLVPVPSEPVKSETEIKKEERAKRLAGTVVLQIDNYAVSVEGKLAWVDKDNKNVVPYIENDRTMIPLRFISESLGAEVLWDGATQTITLNQNGKTTQMQIGKTDYTVDGASFEMDASPVIREDRTMVPLRFVSEALGRAVYWNGSSRVVVVAPADYPWDDTDELSQELMTKTLLNFKWLRDEAYSYLEE